MAIGLTPKHIETVNINNLTQQQLLALVYTAAKQSLWDIREINHTGIVAHTDNSAFDRNALVTIVVHHNNILVEAASVGDSIAGTKPYETMVKDYLTILQQLHSTTTAEMLDATYEGFKEQIVTTEATDVQPVYNSTTTENKNFLSLLIPSKEFFVTPLLMYINVAVFILMVASGVNAFEPDADSLLKWGGNFRPSTLDGEWWRLISNCFLHIGIIHLLLNMYALLYIGVLLEPLLGRTRYFVAYILTGIGASVVSLWWHDLTISAGASGAIFGMYGVFIALLTTSLIEPHARKELMSSIGIFVVYNLVYGLKGGIDNAAHIGGLVSGVVIGYAMIPSLKNNDNKLLQTKTIAGLVIATIGLVAIAGKSINNDIGIFNKQMDAFAQYEERALSIYKDREDTSAQKTLAIIKDTGLYYWSECTKLVNSMDKLDVPKELKSGLGLYKEYCALRTNSCKLFYKAVAENSDTYNDSLTWYNTQIREMIDKIAKVKDSK